MNFRNNFLDQLVGGDTMKDYKHAARLYLDEAFRLSPKNQFLYHVVFNINPSAAGNMLNAAKGEQIELGMLVKAIDLPQYSFNVEMKNQYNYKNYVQTGINYNPVSVTLHDDMGDVAAAFFKSYYQHYLTDTNHAEAEYNRIRFDNEMTRNPSYTRWGLDTGNDERFFNSISVFQLHRQRFTEYRLLNPIINDYNNGAMDQAAGGGIAEQTFSISYSGVIMEVGAVRKDNPQGFATLHYDNSPSPISPLGGGTDSIFGAGGLLGGISTAFGLASEGNFLGSALAAFTTYKNFDKKNFKKQAREEIFGLAGDFLAGATNNLGATSRPGISFPKNTRKRRREAQPIDSQLNNIIKEQKVSKSAKDINLTPTQAKNYIGLNNNAKEKFAKFESFRRANSLSPNDIETAWKNLSTTEKNTYLNNAPADAELLIKRGELIYSIDKEKYNSVITQQGNSTITVDTTVSSATVESSVSSVATTNRGSSYSSGGGGSY